MTTMCNPILQTVKEACAKCAVKGIQCKNANGILSYKTDATEKTKNTEEPKPSTISATTEKPGKGAWLRANSYLMKLS